MRLPDLTTKHIELFWSKVEKAGDDDCWLWTAAILDGGYGCYSYYVSGARRSRTIRAHRLSFFLYYGIDPAGHFVCHSCDNPPCVNPNHLWLGNALSNSRDKVAKGRSSRGERHPISKLTEREVIAIRAGAESGLHYPELAIRFGVSKEMIGLIVRRQSWQHVA